MIFTDGQPLRADEDGVEDRVNNNNEKRGRRRKRDEDEEEMGSAGEEDPVSDAEEEEEDEEDLPARLKKQARERDVLLATSAALMNEVAMTDKALSLPFVGQVGGPGGASATAPAGAAQLPFPYAATLANANVTLDALQSTKMAIAQFAATAMANKDSQSPAAIQELAVLQSTLYALQQQQIMQLQLIQQLQQQLQINNQAEGAAAAAPHSSAGAIISQSTAGREGGMANLMGFVAGHQHGIGTGGAGLEAHETETAARPSSSSENSSRTSTPATRPRESGITTQVITAAPQSPRAGKDARRSRPVDEQHLLPTSGIPTSKALPPSVSSTSTASTTTTTATTSSSSWSSSTYSHNTFSTASLMSQLPGGSLADTILQTPDPPNNPEGPSTLDLLQRTAQQVLNNASQGLLATNLADELGFRNGMGGSGGNGHSGGSNGGDGSCGGTGGSGGKKDQLFKHRCRYCGKVFSSDSALQIHIRSHTGERPFKCNICGNRFTTKGNLKVHFQRHAQRFPHIKMNPHPVPEHLDKFHPPLLAQLDMDESKMSPPPPPPPPPPTSHHHHHHHHGFLPPSSAASVTVSHAGHHPHHHHPAQSSSLFRSAPVVPVSSSFLFRPHSLGDMMPPGIRPMFPPLMAVPPMPKELSSSMAGPELFGKVSSTESEEKNKEEEDDEEEEAIESTKADAVVKTEREDEEDEDEMDRRQEADSPVGERATPPQPAAEESGKTGEGNETSGRDSRAMYSPDDRSSSTSQQGDIIKVNNVGRKLYDDQEEDDDDGEIDEPKEQNNSMDGPENLSGRRSSPLSAGADSPPPVSSGSVLFQPANNSLSSPAAAQSIRFASFPPPPVPAGAPPGFMLLPSDVDPAKDPAIYTNLLPRPGSNDNAWESLIEVTRTSDTAKLQQLVDNIENKLVDPNQCVVCHRVLSCKSALQMHYRTHTGERPFKCKICGRAFTTKGNLKTHMGVHRAKPPARLLHICPVCHKKFTNGLVLQQHIRLHTGEPTDLTPEQIQAAELRDPFPHPGFPFLPAGFHPFLHHQSPFLHHHPSGFPGLQTGPDGSPIGFSFSARNLGGDGKDGGENRGDGDNDGDMVGDAEMGGSSSEALSPTSSTASSQQLHHHQGLLGLHLQHQLQQRMQAAAAGGQVLSDEERHQLIMAQISRANAEFFRKYQQDFADMTMMDDEDDDGDDEDGEEDESMMQQEERDERASELDSPGQSPETKIAPELTREIKTEKVSDDLPVRSRHFEFSPTRASTPGDKVSGNKRTTASSPSTPVISRPSPVAVTTAPTTSVPLPLPPPLPTPTKPAFSALSNSSAGHHHHHPSISPLDLTATRGAATSSAAATAATLFPISTSSSSSIPPAFPGFNILQSGGGLTSSAAPANNTSSSGPVTSPASALSSLTSAVMASPSFNPLNLPISAPGKSLKSQNSCRLFIQHFFFVNCKNYLIERE